MNIKFWWTLAVVLWSYCATAHPRLSPQYPLLGNHDFGNYGSPPTHTESALIQRLQNKLRHLVSKHSNRHNAYHSRSHHHPLSLLHSNHVNNELREQLLSKIDRLLKQNEADLVVLPDNVHRICNRYLKTHRLSPAPLTLVQKDGNLISKKATGLSLPPDKVEQLCATYLGVNNQRDDSSFFDNNYYNDRRKSSIKFESGTLPMSIPDEYWVHDVHEESRENVPHPRSVDDLDNCPLCSKLTALIRNQNNDGRPRNLEPFNSNIDNYYGLNPYELDVSELNF